MSEQNFSNHGKVVPGFAFFVLPVLLINVIYSTYQFSRIFTSSTGGVTGRGGVVPLALAVLVAVALFMLAFFARTFALGVQDRVIRLEERLRYAALLPEDLKPRIGEFTVNQLVSLRFAGDAELPSLARKVLDAKINDRKTIKQMVQNWRPDSQRV
jgi:hypothetical protein